MVWPTKTTSIGRSVLLAGRQISKINGVYTTKIPKKVAAYEGLQLRRLLILNRCRPYASGRIAQCSGGVRP
jgi:hypothetical protein